MREHGCSCGSVDAGTPRICIGKENVGSSPTQLNRGGVVGGEVGGLR